MKLPYTKVKFLPKVKSQTGLTSPRVSCKRALTHVYQKLQSYDVWFLKYEVRQTEVFVILGHFLPFTLLSTWKIKVLKK